MSYQLPGEKKIIEKWDKIPGDITFVLREGDEVGDDGGCAIGGCWVKKTSAELFANKKVVILVYPEHLHQHVVQSSYQHLKKCMTTSKHKA